MANRRISASESQKRQVRKPERPKKNASSGKLSAWKNQFIHAMAFSLKRLWFNSISTWITLATIAIALSLPTSLHILLKNLQTLTDDKREVPTITLFLKQNITEQQALDRTELLSELPEVDKARSISKDEALEDFRELTGFAEALETLGENPLPHVILVTPRLSILGNTEADLEQFSRKLKSYSEVDSVQIDIKWVQKLRTILSIADRIVLVVSLLLGITVLLVIGNTIRLDIENRKEEIQVSRLIGATNSYIRRPFVLGGIWFGLFGGILSLVIVHSALLLLISPVQSLAEHYGSSFVLSGLDFEMTFKILVASVLLGIIGAWLAVSRYLWQGDVVIK